MSMISELVKELRNEAQEVRLCSNECESAELLDRAADTIEMLSEKARADRPQEKTISVDVLREILSDVKEAHRNNYEAGAVISDVWGEVVVMLKGADDEV